MQIPSSNTDPFIVEISKKAEEIRLLFQNHIVQTTRKVPVKVMLGDGTVSDQESFDPSLVRKFFEEILKKSQWSHQGVSTSAEQDLRRIFIKFEVKEGNYLLSAHMSLQYHALLFYRLDHQVIDIQKELGEISDKISQLELKVAPENDKIIKERLEKEGFQTIDDQKLFEILYEREDITQDLTKSLTEYQQEHTDLIAKRDGLFQRLDAMLLEVYHTTSVLIDENRMIAAEEGCLCNFNLEYYKNNIREGNINLSRITEDTKNKLLANMDNIIKSLKN